MHNVLHTINESGKGSFFIESGAERIAEMIISVSGKNLTVHHTEVQPAGEGKGLARELLAAMVDYARKNELKVIALCPYVHAQFKRHAELYSDIWNSNPKS